MNDASGKEWLGVKLILMNEVFPLPLRTHVLIAKDKGLSRESLPRSESRWPCYVIIRHLWRCKGFNFSAMGAEQKIQGDEIDFFFPLWVS